MATSEVEISLADVQKHTEASSCWVIIGNSTNGGPKVYDVTKYLDDHPGGAEVILDVAGQDADEFFEDIGHSKEARSELKKYFIGSLKMDAAAMAAQRAAEEAKKAQGSAGGSSMLLVVAAAVAGVAYFVYQSQSK